MTGAQHWWVLLVGATGVVAQCRRTVEVWNSSSTYDISVIPSPSIPLPYRLYAPVRPLYHLSGYICTFTLMYWCYWIVGIKKAPTRGAKLTLYRRCQDPDLKRDQIRKTVKMPYIWYNLLPNIPIFWIIMETSMPLPYRRYNLVPDRLPEL